MNQQYESSRISLANWQRHINRAAFYHLTHPKSISGIKKHGLLPAAQIKDKSQYKGMDGEPEYVYLFHPAYIRGIIKSIIQQGIKRLAVLEITLPSNLPIERDYHSVTGYLEMEGRNPEEDVRNFFETTGITFSGELTKENIIQHVDMLRENEWCGTYRIYQAIPPKYINFDKWASLNKP